MRIPKINKLGVPLDNDPQAALEDMVYLYEGLVGAEKCGVRRNSGESLCGEKECDEVGCVFDKVCRARLAIIRLAKERKSQP